MKGKSLRFRGWQAKHLWKVSNFCKCPKLRLEALGMAEQERLFGALIITLSVCGAVVNVSALVILSRKKLQSPFHQGC